MAPLTIKSYIIFKPDFSRTTMLNNNKKYTMADDNGAAQWQTIWPQVRFVFLVKIGDTEMMFQEVTGLTSEKEVIEYRAGNSKVFSALKMPGIKKYENITLKKGTFKDDKALWTMYSAVKMNTIERKAVTISLLDEDQVIVMSWILTNAFPCKMTVTEMKSDRSESAVESMELAHEGLALVDETDK